MRVLLISQPHERSRCYKALFQAWGHEIAAAPTFLTAVRMTTEAFPDIIVYDPSCLPLGMTADVLHLARWVQVKAIAIVESHGECDEFDHVFTTPLDVESLKAIFDTVACAPPVSPPSFVRLTGMLVV